MDPIFGLPRYQQRRAVAEAARTGAARTLASRWASSGWRFLGRAVRTRAAASCWRPISTGPSPSSTTTRPSTWRSWPRSRFAYLGRIQNAGEILLGELHAGAARQLRAGTQRGAATSGHARTCSPLSVFDFMKRSSIGYVTAAAYPGLAKHARVARHLPRASTAMPTRCRTCARRR